ncbi:MAG: nickel-responsive transcriptional regulator NikR [Candidatus Aminicenantaceae bacterium]
MEKVTRFGVSMDSNLLKKFDELIMKSGYKNRSEALRDLMRESLVDQEWKEDKEIVGILGIVYNHETHDLTETINHIQHQYIQEILSSTHIHLDHHNCLEVIILKGKSSTIKSISDKMLSIKNVKHGQLISTTTGEHID